MDDKGSARRVAPVPRPVDLVRFAGLWVALLDGEVVAAEPTPHTSHCASTPWTTTRGTNSWSNMCAPTGDSYIVDVG